MLSIRGTSFIAHWAYRELISWHSEHTGNQFHRMLSMRGNVWKSNISTKSNTIFKNLVLQALGTIRFRFLQKKSKKMSCLCTFKNSSTVTVSSLFLFNGKEGKGKEPSRCALSPPECGSISEFDGIFCQDRRNWQPVSQGRKVQYEQKNKRDEQNCA